jgi:hypothetical protein
MSKDSKGTSIKHAIIDKDSTVMVVSVSIAIFIVIFCLFAIRALIDQSSFYGRVITEKEAANKQLVDNKAAVEELRKAFIDFVEQPVNIIGGSAEGVGPKDGDNAQLVLDALPDSYDFPALSSSVEKILKEGGYSIESIGGSANVDPAAALAVAASPSAQTTNAVEAPYAFSIKSSVEGTQKLLETLEKSIRPIHVTSLSLQASGAELSVSIGFKTFYASEKSFTVTNKEVR